MAEPSESSLSASLEDYLEAIYHIVDAKGAARPKDIADKLDVGNSSVTGALKALAARRLVNYAPYDVVTLTADGEEVALDVVHRHESLRQFFVRVLAADDALAEEAACRMEHAVPAELLERFVRFLDFVEMCPRGGPGLLEGFRVHLESGCRPECFDRCPMGVAAADAETGGRTAAPTLRLGELEPGQKGAVVRVRGEGALRRRLVDLGLTVGAEVTLERAAPLGDPLEILVKGSHLSLRRREAEMIEVRIVNQGC